MLFTSLKYGKMWYSKCGGLCCLLLLLMLTSGFANQSQFSLSEFLQIGWNEYQTTSDEDREDQDENDSLLQYDPWDDLYRVNSFRSRHSSLNEQNTLPAISVPPPELLVC